MSLHPHLGYLVCDPQTQRVVRKSRTFPAMTPLEFCVFVVEDKHYCAAHAGDVVNLGWLLEPNRIAWNSTVEAAKEKVQIELDAAIPLYFIREEDGQRDEQMEVSK